MHSCDVSSLRTLVIDDATTTRRIVRSVLQGFGIRHVDEAGDGAEGLDILDRKGADVVVLDWEMPILNGLEFMRLVRIPARRNAFVPVIMMTAQRRRSLVAAARDAGVNEYVIKPFSARTLYDRIINVIVNPRPFIRSKSFFGPDRRRSVNPNYAGPERRRLGAHIELD